MLKVEMLKSNIIHLAATATRWIFYDFLRNSMMPIIRRKKAKIWRRVFASSFRAMKEPTVAPIRPKIMVFGRIFVSICLFLAWTARAKAAVGMK